LGISGESSLFLPPHPNEKDRNAGMDPDFLADPSFADRCDGDFRPDDANELVGRSVLGTFGLPPLPGDLLRLLPGAEDSAVVVAPLLSFSTLSTALTRRCDGDLSLAKCDPGVETASESTVRSAAPREASLVSGPNSACCCSR
jgi:hypothetical protein